MNNVSAFNKATDEEWSLVESKSIDEGIEVGMFCRPASDVEKIIYGETEVFRVQTNFTEVVNPPTLHHFCRDPEDSEEQIYSGSDIHLEAGNRETAFTLYGALTAG